MPGLCRCRKSGLARQVAGAPREAGLLRFAFAVPRHRPFRSLPMPFDLLDLLKATLLGVVEGLTEFLPVSSTGHLLLMERFFGFNDDAFGKTFVVLIQLGAILAILSIYFMRLWNIAIGMFTDARARHFV